MTKRKKATKRRRPTVAALVGAMAIRCAVVDADPESWAVIRVDPVEQRLSGDVVANGTQEECLQWIAGAPSGWSYMLLQMGQVKVVTK